MPPHFRIFLDSNTVQTLSEQGELIFDGGGFDPNGHTGATEEDCWALHNLCLLVECGAFKLVISRHSLKEAEATIGRHDYYSYAAEVAQYVQGWIDEAADDPFDGTGAVFVVKLGQSTFDCLSVKDRLLIADALDFECDTFLTIERRLPRNAEHVRRHLRLQIVRPPELWQNIKPPFGAV